MQFTLDFPVNIIDVAFTILSWGLIVYLIYYFYQKQEVKPNVWKACIATFVGIGVFSIDFQILHTVIKIPLFPFGVWILYGYASSRKGAWNKYRRFAWLGFSANFIFIAATILTVILHTAVYPKSNLSTYLSHYEKAAIVQLHPSAKDVIFDKEKFEQLFLSIEEATVRSMEWYNHTIEVEPNERVEQFPYYLSGTSTKWGSGLPTMIYVEKDGKGILIDSTEKQRYFRSNESFLKGGHKE